MSFPQIIAFDFSRLKHRILHTIKCVVLLGAQTGTASAFIETMEQTDCHW